MTKNEFLKKLRKQISSLPKAEVKEQLGFYSEMIDDRIEEGLSEEDAVEKIGNVGIISAQILSERKDNRTETSETEEKGALTKRDIAVIAIGSPLWVPLAIAVFAIVLSFFACLWSLVLVLWVVELPFCLFSLISKGLFIACKYITKYTLLFTKSCISSIKSFLFKEKSI